jgi:hypothetical protein
MKPASKIALISSTILLLLLFTTDPQRLPSVLLIIPFVLLFVSIASVVPAVLGLYGLAGRRPAKIGTIIAMVSVLLLVLQSLGQLTVRDMMAMTVLFGVAYFYASRFSVRLTN